MNKPLGLFLRLQGRLYWRSLLRRPSGRAELGTFFVACGLCLSVAIVPLVQFVGGAILQGALWLNVLPLMGIFWPQFLGKSGSFDLATSFRFRGYPAQQRFLVFFLSSFVSILFFLWMTVVGGIGILFLLNKKVLPALFFPSVSMIAWAVGIGLKWAWIHHLGWLLKPLKRMAWLQKSQRRYSPAKPMQILFFRDFRQSVRMAETLVYYFLSISFAWVALSGQISHVWAYGGYLGATLFIFRNKAVNLLAHESNQTLNRFSLWPIRSETLLLGKALALLVLILPAQWVVFMLVCFKSQVLGAVSLWLTFLNLWIALMIYGFGLSIDEPVMGRPWRLTPCSIYNFLPRALVAVLLVYAPIGGERLLGQVIGCPLSGLLFIKVGLLTLELAVLKWGLRKP